MLESISARDMFLLLRMTDNSPSLEEILNVFSLLSTDEIDVLEMNKQASAKENTTYTMKNAKATVNNFVCALSCFPDCLIIIFFTK